MRSVLENPSWPGNQWKVEYIKEIDRYRITDEYQTFIADVGPTLVAYWIVRLYNALHAEF
jgi:hypothetical protein